MVDASLLFCLAAPPDRVSPGFHRLVDSNHRPLLELLVELDLPCAVSVPWGLTQRWLSEGYHDCLNLCLELQERATVEFVGTAAYHPILPLLPRPAIERQVAEDSHQHRTLYPKWSATGFAPPELAFGPELLPILQSHGFEWCAVDDAPYSCLNDEPPYSYIAVCGGLKVLMRSRLWSRALIGCARSGSDGAALAAEMLEGAVRWFGENSGYIFLAMDPECFGRHRQGSLEVLAGFMRTVASSEEATLHRPSSLIEAYPGRKDEIPPGSWAMTSDQFWEGEFFVPWQSRYNAAHSHLWELTELAVEAVGKLQQKLDRGLHAGFFWWEQNAGAGLPTGVTRGLRTLLDVVAAAAPEDLDRALELVARLDDLQ